MLSVSTALPLARRESVLDDRRTSPLTTRKIEAKIGFAKRSRIGRSKRRARTTAGTVAAISSQANRSSAFETLRWQIDVQNPTVIRIHSLR
jgi:hypothetical protein